MGLLLAVMVHSASIQERRGFKLLSFRIRHRFPNLKIIWVDGGYDGQPLKVWELLITLSVIFRLY